MKADFGLSNYIYKIGGVILSSLSVTVYTICKTFQIDIIVSDNLRLTRLVSILFCFGLFVFLFSKDKKNDNETDCQRNILNRIILTAIYSTLIVYSLIQATFDNYSINVLTPVAFFLVIHFVLSLILQFKGLSNKGFYLFTSGIFIIGAILFILI